LICASHAGNAGIKIALKHIADDYLTQQSKTRATFDAVQLLKEGYYFKQVRYIGVLHNIHNLTGAADRI
jgi:hypothetical protein